MNNTLIFCLPIALMNVANNEVSITKPVSYQGETNTANTYTDNSLFKEISFSNPVRDYKETSIINKIKSFQCLSDNWDGYGAERPDNIALDNSLRFYKNLPEQIQDFVKEDNISITPYGTIVFDFVRNENLISVEIGNKNYGFFTNFLNKENTLIESKELFYAKLPEDLNKSFAKLF